MRLDKTAQGYQDEGVMKLLKDVRDGLAAGVNIRPNDNDGFDNGSFDDDGSDDDVMVHLMMMMMVQMMMMIIQMILKILKILKKI